SLLAAVAAAVLLGRELAAGESGRIRARYGARLVDARVDVPETRWLTDVGSVDELARVAERFDRVILRDARHGRDVYYVDDGLALYRYRSADVVAEQRSALPARGR
ncbi:MAG: DUF5305 domain-containing protein, partial [Thermoleophilia bacterium]|nr:DUF5305 domain-containing protein [Thermoleophilia bacterium]